ncbi:flavin-nucleotide-binding protein [Methanocella sp. CWC-04]|uniref:Flavin-nucleotide-binding protein n=1 Tax=Methanooceanicella nereidis TaxID=2052831 RepID=A0AAP2W5S1_9EURY|nr:pyridoxamine 5'-phosphate oxidase family protein [Methanocella sp. CWC-04]MCD1294417.1 flavin-nucleotide-binding protein [Methanocella sp. CWC-04]
MVKLTEEIKESLKGVKTIYMATCSNDCIPNVAPMGAYKLLDDETMLISDQFMNKTMKNLEQNQKVAISYWGEKGGYQIKGVAVVHKDDDVFKEDVEWIKSVMPKLTPKSAVVIRITEVYSIKPGTEAGKKIL